MLGKLPADPRDVTPEQLTYIFGDLVQVYRMVAEAVRAHASATPAQSPLASPPDDEHAPAA